MRSFAGVLSRKDDDLTDGGVPPGGAASDLDELLDAAISQENTEQINIRISRALKALLTRLARERATEASTLGRIWLAERIRQEIRK